MAFLVFAAQDVDAVKYLAQVWARFEVSLCKGPSPIALNLASTALAHTEFIT